MTYYQQQPQPYPQYPQPPKRDNGNLVAKIVFFSCLVVALLAVGIGAAIVLTGEDETPEAASAAPTSVPTVAVTPVEETPNPEEAWNEEYKFGQTHQGSTIAIKVSKPRQVSTYEGSAWAVTITVKNDDATALPFGAAFNVSATTGGKASEQSFDGLDSLFDLTIAPGRTASAEIGFIGGSGERALSLTLNDGDSNKLITFSDSGDPG